MDYKKYIAETLFYDVNPFDQIENRILIFFDTETTGFNPHYRQITEIAAIAVDGNTFEELDQFNEIIKLSNWTRRQIQWQKNNPPDPEDIKAVRKRGKSIEEILQMTGYDETKTERYEGKVIIDFAKFIQSFPNPILIAHNAKFDMRMIMTKLKKYNYMLPRYKVFDTLKFSRLFLIPALQSLEDKEDKTATDLIQLLKKNPESKFISASLGNLNQLIKDRLDKINWHSGLSDVQVTIELFKFIKEYYEKYSGETEEDIFKKSYAKAMKRPF